MPWKNGNFPLSQPICTWWEILALEKKYYTIVVRLFTFVVGRCRITLAFV